MCSMSADGREFPRRDPLGFGLRTRGLLAGVVSSERGAPIGLSARQRYLLKVATTERTP